MKKGTTKKKNKKRGELAVVDPRQSNFLAFFLDPKSETFSNALQSALKAGFSKEYAENITHLMPAWLSESIGELQMLSKAERNLSMFLDLPTKVQAMGAFGPIVDKKTKKPIMVENPKLLGHKKDVSMFVAERIGRNRYRRTDARPENPQTPNTTLAVQVNVNEDRERYA